MEDFLVRMWEELIGRDSGPMKIRLILQPIAAAVIAIGAGLRDAREGRALYFWSIFKNPVDRREILRDGWEDIGRVFIIAVVIDFIYQTIVFRWFYPSPALIVAATLALLPYLIFRGLLNRIRRRSHRGAATQDRGVGKSQ
jgi:hypothetical protein